MVEFTDPRTQGNILGGVNTGRPGYVNVDQTGNFLMAQGGGQYTEMARAGGVWNVISGAVAPLAAIPSTTALIEIYNNSGATSQPFVMEVIDLFLFNLLSTAIIHNPSLWAMVTVNKAAPTVGALAVYSQSGRATYTTTQSSKIITASGTTVVANGWRPFGNVTPALETATVGAAWSAPVGGQLLVPPGSSLCLHSVDTTASGTVQLGATWNERSITVTNTIS